MQTADEHSGDTTDLDAAAFADLRLVLETMSALGVTSESIRLAMDEFSADKPRQLDFSELADDEWSVISVLLPPEPPQSKTMGNRQFVSAVLTAMHRGGRWGEYPKKVQPSDAVRRRFGRWSHQGIWQKLTVDLASSALSEDRKRQFHAVAERAERLVRSA